MDHKEQTPEQERYINFYGVPPCGHFLLFLPESQANEQHFCYSCQKTVAMESDVQHLQHVRQAEQERQARIQACAAELVALQPEKPEDSPTYTGQSDDAGNPLFSDAHMPEYVSNETPTPEQERITTLALAVQAHCFDYFDGKLTPAEWLQLVVDAVQSHQAEAQPIPFEETTLGFHDAGPTFAFVDEEDDGDGDYDTFLYEQEQAAIERLDAEEEARASEVQP